MVSGTARAWRDLTFDVTVTTPFRHGLAVLVMGLCALIPAPVGLAQDSKVVSWPQTAQNLIAGPACLTYPKPWEAPWANCDLATHQAWLADIRHWRDERRIRIGFDDARYRNPRAAWIQKAFMQTQAMVEDRYLYDPASGRYTVDRYLDDLEARFGGIDAVLIWPTYPNMGVDDRNQIDMLLSMPGGVEGVRNMVAAFHRRGVRVLFPFMMWDEGTRDPGGPWPQLLAKLMKDVDADGMNGDTQDGVPLSFSSAADATGHPLVFQPEQPPHDEALAWNLMTWGQYTFDFAPKVDRFRWLESRHMVNISDRWARSKTGDLQYAFFNGEGWESWENIWGIWNGITPRDAEATRRVATLERVLAPFLASPDWEPFYPTARFGVFASRWPLAGRTVWTLVNRNEYDVGGPQLTVPAAPGMRWFDLYHGRELTPEVIGRQANLSLPIEAHGFGAVIAVQGDLPADVLALMATMRAMTVRPLSDYDSTWRPLPQALVPITPTRSYARAPEGMVELPAGRFDFKVRGVEVEGDDAIGVDVAYPWEDEPRRFHDYVMNIKRFFIDRTPVTNRQFKQFLDATHYRPMDVSNFLKDWVDGAYPAGWDDRPVVWVSMEDARAYAAWAGKRLPHEWEWQYAAQGVTGLVYPWGDAWRSEAAPAADTGRSLTAPDPVDAHPAGAGPFGVLDMVGNVWQWTDEYADKHTRAAIVRGGSHYRPSHSIWYFPQAYRNDEHGKLLLMAPSRDRSGAIGFRCAADAT